MNGLRAPSAKTVAAGIVAVVVLGGFVLAFLTSGQASATATFPQGASNDLLVSGSSGQYFTLGQAAPLTHGSPDWSTAIASTTVTTMTVSTSTALRPPSGPAGTASSVTANSTGSSGQPAGTGGASIEFFSNVTIESEKPASVAAQVTSLAFEQGGYVAYSSSTPSGAYVVIRVPAANYETALSQVQTLGNVTGLTSSSNDVTIQYTDLNATLASLQTEQAALLRILNASSTVNDTLAVEAQLQQVNAQINFEESQILETQRLISYSTITVTVAKAAAQVQVAPLTMKLSATPKSGMAPLSVTFSAVVDGGKAPYIVNYNFGDGTAQAGQAVIHYFNQGGTYNVTATVTDAAGNVTESSALVKVSSASARVGLANFPATLTDLFVRVVEGMAVVAVIVVPVALVLAAAVVLPLKRSRRSRTVRQD